MPECQNAGMPGMLECWNAGMPMLECHGMPGIGMPGMPECQECQNAGRMPECQNYLQ